MTKKHFEAIAQTMKNANSLARNDGEREIVKAVAESLSRDFVRFNPNFDANRFLTACGY